MNIDKMRRYRASVRQENQNRSILEKWGRRARRRVFIPGDAPGGPMRESPPRPLGTPLAGVTYFDDETVRQVAAEEAVRWKGLLDRLAKH